MDRRTPQLARLLGGGAFLLALALVFGRSLHHTEESEAPLAPEAAPKAAVPSPSPSPTPAAAAGAEIAAQPGRPRPHDVADIPAPGSPRRARTAPAASPSEYPAASGVASYAA